MFIAILGDSHDHYENLTKAVAIANERACELMLHTGDLGAPMLSVGILKTFNGPVKMIAGNNDGEIYGLMKFTQEVENFTFIKRNDGGDSFEDTIDGVRFFMHHYPRIAEIAAHSGLFDVCISGHTHQYFESKIGDTLLINPSSLHPTREPSCFIIYDTETRTHEKVLV